MNALERLMGLILVMMATQMFLDGIRMWMKGKVQTGVAHNQTRHLFYYLN